MTNAAAYGRSAASTLKAAPGGDALCLESHGNLVVLDEEELRIAVESSLGAALDEAVVIRKPAAGKSFRYGGKHACKSWKILRPKARSSAGAPELAVDIKLLSAYMVRQIADTFCKDMSDPAKRTTADVINLIRQSSAARHDALVEQDIKELTEAYAKINHFKSPARASLEDEYARKRADFLSEIPTYLGPELAQIAGHAAGNSSATASRWKSTGKVFSVSSRDGERYPAFQFADGKPLPIIGQVLEILRPTRSEWQIAFWFTSPNAYLDGAQPRERLASGEEILLAARREIDTIIG